MASTDVPPSVIGAQTGEVPNEDGKKAFANNGGIRRSRTADKMNGTAGEIPPATLYDKLFSGEMPQGNGWVCWCVMVTVVFLCFAAGGATVKLSTKEGWFVLSSSETQVFFAMTMLLEKGPTAVKGGIWNDGSYVPEDRRLQQEPLAKLREAAMSQTNFLYLIPSSKCPGKECNLKAGSLITTQNLQHIQAFEKQIFDNSGFQKYCHLVYTSTSSSCAEFRSVITYKPTISDIYGWSAYCNPTNNPSMVPIQNLGALLLPLIACDQNGTYITNHGVPFLKSQSSFGYPVKTRKALGNIDSMDEEIILKDSFATEYMTLYKDATNSLSDKSGGNVRVLVNSALTGDAEMNALLITDMTKAILSFVFVFLYMWFNTASLFIAGIGMLQVVFSVGPALILWYLVDGGKGVQFLQFLTMFMILGIGADDVFVFVDAWNQNKRKVDPNQEDSRLICFILTIREAFSAMLATTSTTALAFLLGVFNPVPSISSFCVFACFVVVFDFVWCITMTASSVAFNDRYLDKAYICCCGKAAEPGKCGSPGCCFGLVPTCMAKFTKQTPGDTSAESFTEKFFSGTMFNFLKAAKIPLLIFWSLLLIGAIISVAVGTKMASTSPKNLPPDHPFQLAADIEVKYFTQEDPKSVRVVWGFPEKPVEKWKSNSAAETVRFGDISSAISVDGQQKLLSLCKSLDTDQTLRCLGTSCLIRGNRGPCATVRNNSVTRVADSACQTGRYCIMEMVKDFRDWQGKAFPIPPADFGPALKSDEWLQYTKLVKEVYRQTEEYWLFDQFMKKTGIIFEENTKKPQLIYMTFNASFQEDFQPQSKGKAIYQNWKDFINNKAPDTNGKATTLMFLFKELQDSLVREAIKSVFLSLAVAFVTLACVTWNWYIAILGTINISIIVVYFMGTWPIIGWELDIYNVIFLISAVGLSVDYTVHLLHAYNESSQQGREQRAKDALSHMGITVFSGAVTTLAAAFPLVLCQMVFFRRYGTFVFIIILVSIVTAILLLVPLLLLVGPDGSFGDIPCFYWLRSKMSGADKKQASTE